MAAIHGACIGGGFELALACHWRIASDDVATQIGFPETSLGTIPGWGGTVRLPRLIGAKPALEHILRAALLNGVAACKAGMIDDVVATADLRDKAKAAAHELPRRGQNPPSIPPVRVPGLFKQMRAEMQSKSSDRLPALQAAIDAVDRTLERPMAEALEIEARLFGEVAAGIVCKNLIRVFFLREAAKRRTLDGWFEGDAPTTASRSEAHARPSKKLQSHRTSIRRIGVVGAGVMGSGLTQWLAAHGFEVTWRDVEQQIVDTGMSVVRRRFDAAVKRGRLTAGEANSALRRISTTTTWDGFGSCGLVIEAIVENLAAKQALFAEMTGIVSRDTILASNTSALPLEEITARVAKPERAVGLHFFNPVSRMPLVELVIGRHTSREHAEQALAVVKALEKAPVICRSSPGFLVTRVLFFYLNEAVRLREQGLSTRQIDGAMREFGWPMGPLRLIDEVGVDVTDFIFRELEHYFAPRFTRNNACGRLVSAKLLGRKNGTDQGFYSYDGGNETVNDLAEPLLVSLPAAENDSGVVPQDTRAIVEWLMRVMVAEAERCLAEGVVRSADEVDFALLSGAGFPAFRGGLLHWARSGAKID
nr:putative 3-hydroxyacyl-CoA dehydrogenase NAD-binding [uncultured bacterium]